MMVVEQTHSNEFLAREAVQFTFLNLNKFTQQEENSCLWKRTTKRKGLAILVQVKVVKLVYTVDKSIERIEH